MILDAIVYGIGVPAVVAALLLIALGKPRRREPGLGGDAHQVATALGAAYVAGHWGLDGPIELVPLDVVDRLPHLAVLGVAWSSTAHWVAGRPAARAALDTGVGFLAAFLLVGPLLSGMQPVVAGLSLGLWGASLAILVRLIERVVEDRHPTASGALLTVYAAAAAGVTAASGTIRVGQLVGVAAAALGAITAATLAFARPVRLAASARVVAMLLWGGILITELYAEMLPGPLVLLALAPVVAWGASSILARRRPVFRFVTELGLVLALVGVAGWRAVVGGMAESEGTEGAPDYGYAYD